MNRIAAILLSGSAAFFLPGGTAASAADMPVKALPIALYDWTGFYAGVHAGYGAGMKDWGGINVEVQGGLGGIQGGYNQQIGNVVIGVEVDASSGFKGSTFETIAIPFSVSNFDARIDSDVRSIVSLATRFGVASDRFLAYGKFGFAWADEHHSQWQQSTIQGVAGAQTVNITGQETRVGPMVGFGAEYAFWGNWSVKGEYDYYDFVKSARIPQSGTLVSFAGTTTNVATTVAIQQRLHVAKFGVNYHFGPNRAEIAPSRPPRSYDWTGLYLGAEGARGWDGLTWYGFDPFGNYPVKGWVGGGVAGVRVQPTAIVVAGVEAEWMGGRIDGGRNDTTSVTVGGTSTQSLSSRINSISMATAQFGFLATDRWLFYVKGGVALAEINHTNNFSFIGGPGVTSSIFMNSGRALHTGGVFGFGTEYAFFGNWSAKLEYNQIRFANQDVFLPGTITEISPVLGTGTTSLPNSAKILGFDLNVVKFGINYRIGPN